MEKGTVEQEDHPRLEDDDDDNSETAASINEENLIINICCDSVFSPNNTSELTSSCVNTEKESTSEILYKNSFAVCNNTDRKFSPGHVKSSYRKVNIEPTCGSGNDTVPRQNKSSQYNIVNEVSCDKYILTSDERNRDKDVNESLNLNALATVLYETGKKCPITAEQITDKAVSQINENEGKASANLVNNNILSPSFSVFTPSCQQQTTTSFQSNTDKTKVSFSFPLSNELHFNFGMNGAFSNMPASKNSFQIKPHNKIATSSVESINTSIGLFERQTDIFSSLPKSTIQMCQFSDSLTTSVECSVPPFNMPLFGISVDDTSKSSSNSHTSENTDAPINNGTGPSCFDFKIPAKTQNAVEHKSESTSSALSFESSACSKNLFPMTVSYTTPVQDAASLENNVLTFPVSTINSTFPATSQQSPSFLKSNTTSPLIKSVDEPFQNSLSASNSMDNNQMTTSSPSPLFGDCNKTPLFDRANAKPFFGSSMTFPKAESSQQSVDTLSYSAKKKPYLAFGCISKHEPFLLEYKTPFKSNEANTSGPLLKSIPYSSNTTTTANAFNFGTSNTEPNFSFGNSSVTPNNSPFIFKHSEKETSKSRYLKRINVSSPCKSHFNNSPEILKIPFRVVKDKDFSVENGKIELRYQCITIMPEYASFSFEELRFLYDKYNELRFLYDKYNIRRLLPTEVFITKNMMINKGTQTSEIIRDHLVDIWKALECPVCLEIVTPPVHQCEQGHHVCNGCWRKIPSCPLCKRYKMQTRNYVAEAMVEKLPLPCKYRVDGCMKTMQQKEKIAHEETCAYRMYCCLVHDCNELHSCKNMVVHMKTTHGHLMTSRESFSSSQQSSWTLTKHNFQKLIHAFEISYWGIFFLRHKSVGQNNYIWMQMINVGTSENGFFYSIEVADIKELRSVSYKGPIFPLHTTVNDNQDCLIIPGNLLSTLKKDSLLCVKISIWRKQP